MPDTCPRPSGRPRPVAGLFTALRAEAGQHAEGRRGGGREEAGATPARGPPAPACTRAHRHGRSGRLRIGRRAGAGCAGDCNLPTSPHISPHLPPSPSFSLLLPPSLTFSHLIAGVCRARCRRCLEDVHRPIVGFVRRSCRRVRSVERHQPGAPAARPAAPRPAADGPAASPGRARAAADSRRGASTAAAATHPWGRPASSSPGSWGAAAAAANPGGTAAPTTPTPDPGSGRRHSPAAAAADAATDGAATAAAAATHPRPPPFAVRHLGEREQRIWRRRRRLRTPRANRGPAQEAGGAGGGHRAWGGAGR